MNLDDGLDLDRYEVEGRATHNEMKPLDRNNENPGMDGWMDGCTDVSVSTSCSDSTQCGRKSPGGAGVVLKFLATGGRVQLGFAVPMHFLEFTNHGEIE
jgi:hypothetical protein